MGAIAARGVTVRRRGAPVLTEVDLRIARGERVGLLGRSGAGKTSLLRVMAGLDRPAEGFIEVDGRPVRGMPEGVTMVFSDDTVYEHLSVEENLAFPLKGTVAQGDLVDRIHRVAGTFFLTRLLHRSPGSLSAGQRRAVSTARALIRSDVTVVLLDDPLVGADQHLRRRLVESIIADRSLTVVFATRKGDDALRWADRVAVLAQGRISQVGRPLHVFRHPSSLEVAEAIGELNRFPAVVSRAEGVLEVAGSRLSFDPMSPGMDDGERVVVGVRPAELGLADQATPFSRRLRGTIGRVEQAGALQRVLFGLGSRPGVGFCALIDSGEELEVGRRVDWSVPPVAMRVFDPVTGTALGPQPLHTQGAHGPEPRES